MNNKAIDGFSNDAVRVLQGYHWPGNVREVENVIERAVILERSSCITDESLMLFQEQLALVSEPAQTANNGSLKDGIDYAEKDIILAALERNRWQRQRTAEELNINRVTLYNKMKKYGLNDK